MREAGRAERCPRCLSNNRQIKLCSMPNDENRGAHEVGTYGCAKCQDPWHDAPPAASTVEVQVGYFGHCPKCGVQLGFGHIPAECMTAIAPSEPGSAERFFNSEADFLRARIRRCEGALDITLAALDFIGQRDPYAAQEAQRARKVK